MAKQFGKTVQVNFSAIPRMADKFNKRTAQYDKMLKQRMTTATRIVWTTAHSKRPLITKTEMRATGRSYRVSDPTATLGVPVKTGALQASIKQQITKKGNLGYQGEVSTKWPYAAAMEYGVPERHIAARPFMRPAININKETVKKVFELKVESNL